ncbi:zinc-dependent peptidase [Sulfurimonas paralvinellae]|uniref:Zinc-dependent peptidase n=1 Tax=Sulfurimonas paralvinellae TaxID=317658 RepID=A0A7M1B7V4_9BACT|nr:M90 family metallopeptidase [Sulfurimonas paralvinellae]QOP45780.1 zinc-dependent peptidase [Sulfurimonas paralvinellae]
MSYYLALLLVFGGLGLFIFTLMIFLKVREEKRIQKLLAKPFKEEYRKYLQATPHYNRLTQEDKTKIERSITFFTNTKEFIGVDIEVTDEMKVIIAFYACLLLLHKTTTNCYDNLKTIIIYPNAVAFENVQATNGIYTKEKFLIDGQSANDTVIIVWHDAKKEAYHLRHDNVIVHEFAHEIDFMDGEIDGIPPIERSKYDEWSRVLFGDFKKLNNVALKNREWGKYKLLGSYAATNEAEFFAVATERFFESPHSLKKHFPELYKELQDFYKINTAELVQ